MIHRRLIRSVGCLPLRYCIIHAASSFQAATNLTPRDMPLELLTIIQHTRIIVSHTIVIDIIISYDIAPSLSRRAYQPYLCALDLFKVKEDVAWLLEDTADNGWIPVSDDGHVKVWSLTLFNFVVYSVAYLMLIPESRGCMMHD